MAAVRSRTDSPTRKSAWSPGRAGDATTSGLATRKSVRISLSPEQRGSASRAAASNRSLSSDSEPRPSKKTSHHAQPRKSALGDADFESLMRKYRGMYSANTAFKDNMLSRIKPAEKDNMVARTRDILSDSQMWIMTPADGDNFWAIQQKSTMRCLDAFEVGHCNVCTRPPQFDDTQTWLLFPLGDSNYTMQQKSNMRYVFAYEQGHDHQVVTRPYQDDDSQKWIITVLDQKGSCTIQQKSTGRYLDAFEDKGYTVVTRPEEIVGSTVEYVLGEPQMEPEDEADDEDVGSPERSRSSMQDFVDILLDHDDLEAAYKAIDRFGSNRVRLSEFRESCRLLNFDGDIAAVFRAIDSHSRGFIGKKDFAELFRYIHEFLEKFGVQMLDRDREREKELNQESFARKLV